MTIKPIINQQVSKDDQHQENQVQNINNSCSRTNRNLQLSTSENQVKYIFIIVFILLGVPLKSLFPTAIT